jgi:nucleotide-binding universal stress UspA family protein
MRDVLLPVDGSNHAFQAALYLIDFVKAHGSLNVHVVNVEPSPLAWQTHGMEAEAIQEHLTVHAHTAMSSALHALNEAGIPHQSHVRFGDTAETIVALADELACDTIVMGTRGLGALSGLALGSVTRKVLNLARIPVACVKSLEQVELKVA